MKADVIDNPCERCLTRSCNNCRNDYTCLHNELREVSLSRLPSIGLRLDFKGCVSIRPIHPKDTIKFLGEVVSKPGGIIKACGIDAKHNEIQLKYNGSFKWEVTELVGNWEVET